MFLVALILAVAAGLFYGAGNNALPWANDVCRYGDVLCQHPSLVGVPAVLSLIWAFFLRVDRL